MAERKKKTTLELKAMKERGEKIAMITAYDATFTRILDGAGVDMVLVGDSLGMVIQGYTDTLHVTLDEIVYHARIVRRGISKSHLCVDLPFMSYQVSPEQTLESAGRLMKEGGAESVKLEGGAWVADRVFRLTQCGIPVVGHIGLTPQSIHQFGGFKIQGRDEASAKALKDAAVSLEQAGAFALVLEGIPAKLAGEITKSISIPTIGIGAGPDCDGQVLVIYDLLGMDNQFNPKFAKKYARLADTIGEAVQSYIKEVRDGAFPGTEHTYS
ncbi:MAG: 3-methyl-2-oxobutanoate hydroxymethyltransferase [Bdellovibrionota bacterium]